MQRTFLQARLFRESSVGVRGAQHAPATLQEADEVRTDVGQLLVYCHFRNRPDQWRRYGALKTIHVIGGWTCRDDNGSKVFERVEPGTPLPPEPSKSFLSVAFVT